MLFILIIIQAVVTGQFSTTATSTQLYSAGYIKLNTTTNGINVYNGESGGTSTINVTKGSGDAEVVCQRTGGSGIKLRGSHPSSFLETTNDTGDLNIRRNTNTRIVLGSKMEIQHMEILLSVVMYKSVEY